MKPEYPNANGWFKPYRGKKYHYFAGKFLWSLSFCGRVYVPIFRLVFVPTGEFSVSERCKICVSTKESRERLSAS